MSPGSPGLHSALLFATFTQFLFVLGGVYLFLRYLRARRQRDQLRQEKEVIFGFMHDVGEVFASGDAVSPDALLRRVLFYAQRTCRATSGAVYLFEGDSDVLRPRAVSGIFPPLTEPVGGTLDATASKSKYIEQLVLSRAVKRGEGLIGQVGDLGAPVLVADGETDPRIPRHDSAILRVRSALLVPLRYQQQTIGVLAVVNRVDGFSFTEADQSLLQALADQAAASVHYAGLREVLAEKKRIDHDLAVARHIQSSLLPKDLPQLPGFELAAFNEPAQQIGGDYYDFVRVDAGHIGIAIADVSGKGIGGALMMTICRSVLRAQAPGNLSPASVLRAMSRVLNKDVSDDMFVTILYMILNLDTRELVIARAGHERPLLVSGGSPRPLESAGAASGMVDDDTFDALLRETSVTLGPGDLVVAYTDGITDAMNAAGEEWGFQRLCGLCQENAGASAHTVLTNIRQSLGGFVGDREQYDDMTLLAIRRSG
jgi:sigma-B regulation protein RsbU (phosphoserine phosphatase)